MAEVCQRCGATGEAQVYVNATPASLAYTIEFRLKKGCDTYSFESRKYLEGRRLYGIEVYSSRQVLKSPKGIEVIDEDTFKKGFLSLKTYDSSDIVTNIPLFKLSSHPSNNIGYPIAGFCPEYEHSCIKFNNGISDDEDGKAVVITFHIETKVSLDMEQRTKIGVCPSPKFVID